MEPPWAVYGTSLGTCHPPCVLGQLHNSNDVMIIILGDRQRKMRELWGVHVCMYLYNKRERMKRWLEHIA